MLRKTERFSELIQDGFGCKNVEVAAETAANYSITNDVSVLAASLQPDLLTVELTTSIHTEGVYSVSVSNVRDRATTPNTIAPSSSANYTYVDNTAPAIASRRWPCRMACGRLRP